MLIWSNKSANKHENIFTTHWLFASLHLIQYSLILNLSLSWYYLCCSVNKRCWLSKYYYQPCFLINSMYSGRGCCLPGRLLRYYALWGVTNAGPRLGCGTNQYRHRDLAWGDSLPYSTDHCWSTRPCTSVIAWRGAVPSWDCSLTAFPPLPSLWHSAIWHREQHCRCLR